MPRKKKPNKAKHDVLPHVEDPVEPPVEDPVELHVEQAPRPTRGAASIMSVLVLKNYGCWMAGDRCGFPVVRAAELIQKGIVKEIKNGPLGKVIKALKGK